MTQNKPVFANVFLATADTICFTQPRGEYCCKIEWNVARQYLNELKIALGQVNSKQLQIIASLDNKESYVLCHKPFHNTHVLYDYSVAPLLNICVSGCEKCAPQTCMNNIKTGHCTDPVVRGMIGARFFANAYNKNQKTK